MRKTTLYEVWYKPENTRSRILYGKSSDYGITRKMVEELAENRVFPTTITVVETTTKVLYTSTTKGEVPL